MALPQSVRELKEDFPSFKSISVFNFEPSLYVDATHLPNWLEEKTFSSLAKSQRCQHRLSEWLLGHFQVEDFFLDFPEEYSLVLYSRETLETLCLYVGALLVAQKIRQVVLKEAVQALKTEIGPDVYAFVLKKEPLYRPFLENFTTNDIPTELTRNTLLSLGQNFLEKSLSGAPKGIRKRFLLKWPQSCSLNISEEVSPEKKSAYTLLNRLLQKEISQQACLN